MAQSTREPKQQGEEKDNEGFDFYEAENTPTVIGRDQARDMEEQFAMPSPGEHQNEKEHLAPRPREDVYDKPGAEESNPNPSAKDKAALSKDELAKEEAGAEGSSDSFYRDSSTQSGSSRYRSGAARGGLISLLLGNRRRALGAGGITAAIISLAIFGFLALAPLKILHIVTNLQNHFFATSENAMQKETDRLFSNYVKKYVLPAAKPCAAQLRVDKNCNPIAITSNPVTRLYRGWRNARLEDKLATNYGLEFGYNTRTKHYYMKTPSTKGNEIDMTNFVNDETGMTLDDYLSKSNDPEFKKVSRAEIRQAVRDSLANETQWKRVMYRYKVGKLLEQKFGIKRCITNTGCKIVDKITDTIQKPKNVAKAYIAERVLMPRSEVLGTVFTCLYIDADCHPETATVEPCSEGSSCAANGTPQSNEDRKIQGKLDGLVVKFAGDNAFKIYDEISKSGTLSQYMVKSVVATFATDAFAKTTADKIPVIGWINLGAQVVDKAKHIGPSVKKLSYVTNAGSMVALYATYRTYADETKSGNISASDVGAFTDTLGPSSGSDKGGTASAEQTPLYNQIIGGSSTTAITAASPIFGTAYAATASDSPYLCDNGKPPASSICPEESLNSGNSVANSITDTINSPGWENIRVMADAWNSTVGVLFKVANGALSAALGVATAPLDASCHIPSWLPNPGRPYCTAKDIVAKSADYLMTVATEKLIPNPFSSNMSGGRTFDLMAGGADVSGNDYAHSGLGGRKLSDGEVATIVNEQQQQRLDKYNSESFIARVFDTESDQSPVSKLAMAMPHSLTSTSTSIASVFSNPLSKIANVFGSIFTLHASAAGLTAQPDPFGVTQYGYTDADITAIGDSETYWDQHCSENPSQGYQNDQDYKSHGWNQAAADSAASDPNYMPFNTETNPCILIKAATGSAGAMYDSSLLTADDLEGTIPDSLTPAGADTGDLGTCSVNRPVYADQYSASQLAQIFGDPGIASSHPQMDSRLASIDFNGHSVQVNKLVAPCLKAVADDIKTSNINYQVTSMGCYRFDSDNGVSNIGLRSYHTYGAACDINPETNPFSADGSPKPYTVPQAYVEIFNRHGFTWGGNWHSKKDYMHFEWHGVAPG